MSATPVWPRRSTSSSTPFAARPESASSPSRSSPTAPTIRTEAPMRAAATAWFAPFPPGKRSNCRAATVSPGRGSRSIRATKSTLIEPTTVSSTATGRRSMQRARRCRSAPGRAGSHAGRTGPPRASRDRARPGTQPPPKALRARGRARPARGRPPRRGCGSTATPARESTGSQSTSSARARLAEPRAALGALGLEARAGTARAALELRQRLCDPLGRLLQRRRARRRRRRRRRRPAPSPRAAGRRRASASSFELAIEPAAVRSPRRARRCLGHSLRWLSPAHVSTTTGRIIGRRRVRS